MKYVAVIDRPDGPAYVKEIHPTEDLWKFTTRVADARECQPGDRLPKAARLELVCTTT